MLRASRLAAAAGWQVCVNYNSHAAPAEALVAEIRDGGGTAIAVKASHPGAEVLSVEPAGFDDMARSLKSGRRERNAKLSGSICDALLAETPGEMTFEVAKRVLSGGVTVSDDEVRAAIRFAFLDLKLVLEPGGAASLAAVLEGRVATKGRTVVAVLSGGNIDPAQFAQIIQAA